MKTTTLTAMGAVLCSLAAPLAAADLSHKAQAALNRVKTSDLDLSQAEGQALLEQRLAKAKQRVCRRDERGQIVSASAERACIAGLDRELSVELVMQSATERQAG